MSVNRLERVNALIKREIGESLFQIINDEAFDMATVTVTHVVTARNLRTARVLVSIRGDEDKKKKMLNIIRRHRTEIQRAINRDLTLKYTPKLHIDLDRSIENGHHVLDILGEISVPDVDSLEQGVE
jgi:ribosome-binding factor A